MEQFILVHKCLSLKPLNFTVFQKLPMKHTLYVVFSDKYNFINNDAHYWCVPMEQDMGDIKNHNLTM